MRLIISWCFADGTRRDLLDQKGKEQLVHDTSAVLEAPRSIERPDRSNSNPPHLDSNSTKESDAVKFPDERFNQPVVPVENEQDGNCSVSRGKTDIEITREDAIKSHASHDSSIREIHTPSEQSMLEDSGPSVDGFANDITNASVPTTFFTSDGVLQRPEDSASLAQNSMDCNNPGKSYSDKKYSSLLLKDKWKPASGMSGQNYPAMAVKDSNVTVRNFYQG